VGSDRDPVTSSVTDIFDRFAWLRAVDARLAEAYRAAHDTAFDAPRAAYVALRGFAETFVGPGVITTSAPPGATLFDRIEAARKLRLVPDDVLDHLDALRRDGNVAAHGIPADRMPEHPIVHALRLAWTCAAWLHRHRGGREEEVPTFQAPSLADSAAVFRDAMLGGHMGGGDPLAKFHVAQALLEHQDRLRRKARTEGDGFSLNRRPEVIELLRDAAFEVPAARALLVRLTLEKPSLTEAEIAEALEALAAGCEEGDPASLFDLGVIYFHGLHQQAIDRGRARDLFERAAVHEHPGALHALSVIHAETGEADSEQRARALAQRAAEAGDLFGQTTYGCMLVEGHGGPVDPAAGATWLRRAARAGWPPAVWCLVTYLRAGQMSPQEGEDVEALLARACELGSVDGLLDRAEAALRENGPSADFARALTDLTEAVARAAVAEQRALVGERLRDALRRLRLQVNALPETDDRRRELCGLLVHFRGDGSPRPGAELGELLSEVAREVAGSGPKASFEAWKVTFQASLGMPDPTASDIVRMRARIPACMKDLRDRAREAGRNAPCPCGSPKKAKHCHGRG
jgi:TPR repeat protein